MFLNPLNSLLAVICKFSELAVSVSAMKVPKIKLFYFICDCASVLQNVYTGTVSVSAMKVPNKRLFISVLK
jgi:hypothetical protein